MNLLEVLGAELPVFAAPMAGGPTTPALVTAAADIRSFGFLAGGYRTAEDLADQIAKTSAVTDRFGVNLFVPGSSSLAEEIYRGYRERLLPIADRYGVDLPDLPRDSDDEWSSKVDLLLELTPPVVSFTFGIPERKAIQALHQAGIVLAQTVTSPDEAAVAIDAEIDMLVVQAPAAGGHSGTFTPEQPLTDLSLTNLVRDVKARTNVPVIAGGGVASAADVRSALEAGATAVSVGTALLLADEAGTSATHRQALNDFRDRPTTITRAFTGRPARGIENAFIREHLDAPFGYPAIHFLTQPIRRAAAAAGEPENLHLWAGTGFARASAQPVATILTQLSGG